MSDPANKCCKIAELTLMGTGFAFAGAVLTTYVPAFHQPVEWLSKAITTGHKEVLCKIPGASGRFFADNPLLKEGRVTEFLAMNTLETGLIGGMIVTIGGAMGIAGIDKHKLQKTMPMLKSLDCSCRGVG